MTEFLTMNPRKKEEGEIAIYNLNDSIRLEVRLEQETVWLDRAQMSLLFDRDKKTIGKHINTALEEELKGIPTVANFEIVQQEGNRWIKRSKEFYNRAAEACGIASAERGSGVSPVKVQPDLHCCFCQARF